MVKSPVPTQEISEMLSSIPRSGISPGSGISHGIVATYSSILTWRIPWTEEPSRLQAMGLQRVGHDWATEHTGTHEKSATFTLVWYWQVCHCRQQELSTYSRTCLEAVAMNFHHEIWDSLFQSFSLFSHSRDLKICRYQECASVL